jgi:hypothetical protein
MSLDEAGHGAPGPAPGGRPVSTSTTWRFQSVEAAPPPGRLRRHRPGHPQLRVLDQGRAFRPHRQPEAQTGRSMKLKTVLGLRPRSRRVPPPVARRRHFPRVGGRAVATHADLHRRTSVRTQGAEPGTTATHHPICRLPPVEPRGGRMIAGPQSLTFEASSIRATDPHRSLTRADQGRWAQSSSWRKAHLVRCESRTAAMWSQKSPSRSQRANSTLASVSRRAAAW